ncbi:MAG TPA: hypothetical protein VFY27_01605, partial [Woeseiaceae bacterium]|nr:hypothetical protein [Woeseiaceae bacterium]
SGVPFIGAFCAAMAVVVKIQLGALKYLRTAVDKMANALSKCSGKRGLWKMMKGLEQLASVVHKSFPAIGIAESISIAQANGASFGIVVNGKFTNVAGQLTLPVKAMDFKEHCPFVESGGPGFELQSYQCSEGPLEVGRERIKWTLLVPFTTLVAQPIFSGMVAKHNSQIGCKNDPSENSKIPVTLNSLEQCVKYDAKARWSHVWAETVQLSAAQATLTMNDFIPWRPRKEYAGSKGADDAVDAGELGGQLGGLGIPTGGPVGEAAPEKPLGKGNELIDIGTERVVDPVFNQSEVACDGARYPFYQPPKAFPDYDWNASRPGLTAAFSNPQFCLNCQPIKNWGKFTWVSGQHVVGGPETSGGYFIRVERREIPPKDEEKEEEPKFVYVVETVSLISAGTTEMDQEEFDKYLEEQGQGGVNAEGSQSSSGCGNDRPKPYVLDKGTSPSQEKDFQDRLRFIGIVWKDLEEDPPFWSGFYDEPPPTQYAYAQGQVYNYLSEDTFTQDWRVRLEQASLLEGFLKSDAAKGQGVGKFVGSAIGKVNNH